MDRWLLSRCGLGGRRFFPALGPAGWNGLRRAAYSAAVLPGALVVGARSLAILGNLLDYQRLSSSARLSSRQHGRLLVSLSRHSIGRARMQARNCRESEVGPPRLSIHSRASRAPLLLLQPLGGNRSLARPARSRPAWRALRSITGTGFRQPCSSPRRRCPGEGLYALKCQRVLLTCPLLSPTHSEPTGDASCTSWPCPASSGSRGPVLSWRRP